jgi:hypothetical protein
MLLALIALRPVLLQTGDTDRGSDPRGEFLASVAARPVSKLLGKQGVDTDQMPSAGQAILSTGCVDRRQLALEHRCNGDFALGLALTCRKSRGPI